MIYVFKTNVPNSRALKSLKPLLNESLNKARWSFDLEDCDRILRVESASDVTESVTTALQSQGFLCTSLED